MKLFVFLVIVCTTVPTLEAIECYECNTLQDQGCSNVKDGDKYVVTCPKSTPTCFVAQAEVGGYTHRGCFAKADTACKTEKDGRICFCNKDKCNSSDVVTCSFVSMFALISVIVYNYC